MLVVLEVEMVPVVLEVVIVLLLRTVLRIGSLWLAIVRMLVSVLMLMHRNIKRELIVSRCWC